MIETGALTAEALHAALVGFTCPRMFRALRNRTPVTTSHWSERAGLILPGATWQDRRRLAAALYAACGEFADTAGLFSGRRLSERDWLSLTLLTRRYLSEPPDRALYRLEFEQQRATP